LRILRDRPQLVHVRSVRRHRATLLTYVGANGVEDFRQQTPANVVDVVELLIRSGADVNAVSDLYGGSTTLGLAATSVHPARAGVQRALIDALLAHGAALDGAVASGYTGGVVVNACLANGRGDAAVHLASRGAAVDLEGACGIGRLDIVRQFVDPAGVLTGGATDVQVRSGFHWACEYGRNSVVEFLLRLPVDLRPKHDGVTGLHWAAHGAHTAIVRLLVDAGHAPDVADDRWGSTPLGWALHGWQDPPPDAIAEEYYATVSLLRSRGAEVAASWIENPRVRADARMQRALTNSVQR
jgi:ankyrin repeat protein